MKRIILDRKGQISLEYILSSMIVIIIICLILIPILLTAIDYSNDIIDSINCKNELSKITDAIDYCSFSGKGSKRIVYVDFNQDVDIRFFNNGQKGFASINLPLSSGSKLIKDSYEYDNLNENIHLPKGFSKIRVEWSEDSDKIEVDKSI